MGSGFRMIRGQDRLIPGTLVFRRFRALKFFLSRGPLAAPPRMASSSGKSGHVSDTGGVTGKMIEPVRPLLNVIAQRQARDRLQRPHDLF